MNFDNMTDTDLAGLQNLPKCIINPKTQWIDKRGHWQKTYDIKGGDILFSVYLRQSTNDPASFSCGILLKKPSGDQLTLSRYNGYNHNHSDIVHQCHVHKTIEENLSYLHPEKYAERTDKYRDLAGAVDCLRQDYCIDNMPLEESVSSAHPLLDGIS